jgi:protein-L-isoaspartate(D-aspartate) O-methyltransferase
MAPIPVAASVEREPVPEGLRKAMVQRIAQLGVRDKIVLDAMLSTPRHAFLEPGMVGQAYIDASLPIGHHQTISQPYIVARMIELMRAGKNLDRVLEVGTVWLPGGSFVTCSERSFSIERIRALHDLAKSNLRPLRIANIRLHYGDGCCGLKLIAPFDGIILAAAGIEIPEELLQQLKIGGRLVAPVGGKRQILQLVERISQAEWRSTEIEQCHFVPLRSGVT